MEKYEYHSKVDVPHSRRAVYVKERFKRPSPFIAAAGLVLAVGTGVLSVIGRGIVGATRLLRNSSVNQKQTNYIGGPEARQIGQAKRGNLTNEINPVKQINEANDFNNEES